MFRFSGRESGSIARAVGAGGAGIAMESPRRAVEARRENFIDAKRRVTQRSVVATTKDR